MTDYAKLKQLAEAATPGPRSIGNENNDVCEVALSNEFDLRVSLDRHDGCTGKYVISREQMLANAHFIEACDPATVRALLAELEAVKAERDRLAEFARDMLELMQLLPVYGHDSEVRQTLFDHLECCGLLDSEGKPVGEWAKQETT